MRVSHETITTADLLGMDPSSPNIYFGFEVEYAGYQSLSAGPLPRTDLVTFNVSEPLRPIEIKLTALPDNSTSDAGRDDLYGSEIVVRPDTIVYLALSIANKFASRRQELATLLNASTLTSLDWENEERVRPLIPAFAASLDSALRATITNQSPFVMQPIWKTQGKLLQLAPDCFDLFVWSDLAFTRLFVDVSRQKRESAPTITRHMRTVVWLVRMLYDFAIEGRIDHRRIINRLTYRTKNDKAFALGGRGTLPYMTCGQLTHPRIQRSVVRELIIGGGERYLSPERRLDAAIMSTPGLFA